MSSKYSRLVAIAAAALALPVVVVGGPTGTAGAAPGDVGTAPLLPPLICDRHIEIGNRSAYEGTRHSTGDGLYTYLTFSITSSGCNRAGTVDLHTMPGTAWSGSDYLPVHTTVEFDAGSSATRYVTVRVVRDGSPGANQFFHAVLFDASPDIEVDDPLAQGMIINDDNLCVPPPEWLPPPPPMSPDYHCSE